jgi:hypothetical protein
MGIEGYERKRVKGITAMTVEEFAEKLAEDLRGCAIEEQEGDGPVLDVDGAKIIILRHMHEYESNPQRTCASDCNEK